jgi:hypothetical protein
MSNSTGEETLQAKCPLCGSAVVPESEADTRLADWIKLVSRVNTFVWALIPVGAIVYSGGILLACYISPMWGYGLEGFGAALVLVAPLGSAVLNNTGWAKRP